VVGLVSELVFPMLHAEVLVVRLEDILWALRAHLQPAA
jgi:hypothetical protein